MEYGLVQRLCPTPSACRHSVRSTTTGPLCHFIVCRVANQNEIYLIASQNLTFRNINHMSRYRSV